MEYKASSEGSGRGGAMSYFESNYKEDMNREEGITMAVKALHKATEGKLNPDATEIGIVDKDTKFKILPQNETKELVSKIIGGK